MANEKNLENRLKKFLKQEGCWFIKYWGGGGFTRSGVPDLLICCNGCFVAAELKATRGKPTELQIKELLRIRKAGGISMLVYPEDEEDLKKLILKLKVYDLSEVRTLQEKLEDKVEFWAKKYKIPYGGEEESQ